MHSNNFSQYSFPQHVNDENHVEELSPQQSPPLPHPYYDHSSYHHPHHQNYHEYYYQHSSPPAEHSSYSQPESESPPQQFHSSHLHHNYLNSRSQSLSHPHPSHFQHGPSSSPQYAPYHHGQPPYPHPHPQHPHEPFHHPQYPLGHSPPPQHLENHPHHPHPHSVSQPRRHSDFQPSMYHHNYRQDYFQPHPHPQHEHSVPYESRSKPQQEEQEEKDQSEMEEHENSNETKPNSESSTQEEKQDSGPKSESESNSEENQEQINNSTAQNQTENDSLPPKAFDIRKRSVKNEMRIRDEDKKELLIVNKVKTDSGTKFVLEDAGDGRTVAEIHCNKKSMFDYKIFRSGLGLESEAENAPPSDARIKVSSESGKVKFDVKTPFDDRGGKISIESADPSNPDYIIYRGGQEWGRVFDAFPVWGRKYYINVTPQIDTTLVLCLGVCMCDKHPK